jgi:hypothetical protein
MRGCDGITGETYPPGAGPLYPPRDTLPHIVIGANNSVHEGAPRDHGRDLPAGAGPLYPLRVTHFPISLSAG